MYLTCFVSTIETIVSFKVFFTGLDEILPEHQWLFKYLDQTFESFSVYYMLKFCVLENNLIYLEKYCKYFYKITLRS